MQTILNYNENFVLFLVGAPKSGKTYFIKHLIKNMKKKFTYGIIFSPTAIFNGSYNFIKSDFIHAEVKPNIINNMLEIQQKYKKRAYIIFDDCMCEKGMASDLLKQLISRYRHYNLSIIITTQDFRQIVPTIRKNTTFCVIFKLYSDDDCKSIKQQYMPELSNKESIITITSLKKYYYLFVNINEEINKKYIVEKLE